MEWTYFAGLFDGEGTIGIYKVGKKYWSVKMQLVGAHKPMIKAVYDFIGDGSFTSQKKQGKIIHTPRGTYEDLTNFKQGWKWTLCSRPLIEKVLKEILPFLHEKKEQAKIALDYINGKLSGQDAEYRCKEAKRFNFPHKASDEIFFNTSKRVPWNKGKKGLQVAWNRGKKGVSEETRSRMVKSALNRKDRKRKT
jgi:hypothetical protein